MHLRVARGAYLKQKISFKFDPEYLKVTSDDPQLYLQYVGSRPDMGTHFVMHADGKQVGFSTTDFHPEDKSETLPDGTHTWRIDEVGCSVWADKNSNSKEVGARRFRNKSEQDRFMDVFLQALANFRRRIISVDRKLPARLPDPGVPLAEYTDRVLQKTRCGEYLK